jgi:hypothetical protein
MPMHRLHRSLLGKVFKGKCRLSGEENEVSMHNMMIPSWGEEMSQQLGKKVYGVSIGICRQWNWIDVFWSLVYECELLWRENLSTIMQDSIIASIWNALIVTIVVLHSVFMIPLFMVVVEILETMITRFDLGGKSKGFISDYRHQSSKHCSLNNSKSIS